MKIYVPDFHNKSDLFKFLRENKELHIMQKKSEIKKSDGVFNIADDRSVVKTIAEKYVTAEKAVRRVQGRGELPSSFPLSVIINTTNLMDSHKDVHMVDIWKKSLKEPKLRYLLQEHEMKFSHIISDEISASTDMVEWKNIGFKFPGSTQALIYDCTVETERNAFMAEQYWKGYVLNHSVGMQYVKLYLCMNSESKYDIDERDNYEKYKSLVVNLTEDDYYFWAVTEAKEIEGSAVPMGSNWATPIRTIGEQATKEPVKSTLETEPPQGTQKNGLSFLLG